MQTMVRETAPQLSAHEGHAATMFQNTRPCGLLSSIEQRSTVIQIVFTG